MVYKHVFDIKPTYATSYSIYDLERANKLLKRPPVRSGTRMLSAQSRKLLLNAVNWLVLFSPVQKFFCDIRKRSIPFRVNFITLTLAGTQQQPDDYIKNRLLQPFLKWLIRKGATGYIWKAETQNNGNIHFHITTNVYIHWSEVRAKWNDLQEGHGFLNDYIDQYGSNDPNSVDVHGVYKHVDLINNIGNYFGKVDEWCRVKGTRLNKVLMDHPSRWLSECENSDQKFPVPKRQVDGRKWAVSNNLSDIRCFLDDNTSDINDMRSIRDDMFRNVSGRYIQADYAGIYIYDEERLFARMNPVVLNMLSDCYYEFLATAPKP